MSGEVNALAVVEYNPGQILQSTVQYTVERVNSSRLKTFRLTLKDPANPALNYILQTGAAVEILLNIPVSHRLLKVGWAHTTAAPGTPSVDALVYQFSQYAWGASVLPIQYDTYTGVASRHYIELEGFGYNEPAATYLVSTDTTLTDRVYMFIDLQVISEGV